jgi:hypothetical protein
MKSPVGIAKPHHNRQKLNQQHIARLSIARGSGELPASNFKAGFEYAAPCGHEAILVLDRPTKVPVLCDRELKNPLISDVTEEISEDRLLKQKVC